MNLIFVSPVMKPALEAVGYWSPTVWKPSPANRVSPATAPAASRRGWRAAACRGRTAASSAAAAARNR
jgi:hypothetical protein